MQPHGRIRVDPKISTAKMAEYLEASAHRRERILCDQKWPAAFITSTYTDAQNAIRAALVDGGDVAARLRSFATRTQGLFGATQYETTAIQCCSSAAARFANAFPSLGLDGVTATRPSHVGFTLDVEGVTITAAPVVLLHRVGRSGAPETGALLTMFRKGKPMGPYGGKVAAEIVRRSLDEAGYDGVHPTLCVALDVFGGGVYRATRHYKQIAAELTSACREIADRWPALPASGAGRAA